VKIIKRKLKLLLLYSRILAPVIDEKLMDAATVLAASGTAFALRYKSIDAGWYRNRV
jgi:pyrroline-5-carboxylate reductase